MALFEQFPYTNFHEMNMDWLLQEVNKLKNFPNIINEGSMVITIDRSDPLNITADKTFADIKSAITGNIPILIRVQGESGYRVPKVCTLWSLSALRLFLPDVMEYNSVDQEYDMLYNWYFEVKSDDTIVENTDRVTLTPQV